MTGLRNADETAATSACPAHGKTEINKHDAMLQLARKQRRYRPLTYRAHPGYHRSIGHHRCGAKEALRDVLHDVAQTVQQDVRAVDLALRQATQQLSTWSTTAQTAKSDNACYRWTRRIARGAARTACQATDDNHQLACAQSPRRYNAPSSPGRESAMTTRKLKPAS